ncbi:unnamed protein product [Calicophoron daubneyi]|uniref:Elongin-A n=1 Tax=Calicophoron daubneyi TaxID=300641 RepID=A0AAV2TWN3_CALDB
MSNSVVVALVKFGETLGDSAVEEKAKLRVLGTLNEVTLTLSELSESGVGRAVSKLKNVPGELGQTARTLVTKWKRLLRDHLAKESLSLPTEEEPSQADSYEDVQAYHSPSKHESAEGGIKTRPADTSAVTGFDQKPLRASSSRLGSINSAVPTDLADPPHTSKTSSSRNKVTSITHTSSPDSMDSSESVLKVARKRKLGSVVDSIDSSSGMSFMESLNTCSKNRTSKKKKLKRVHTTDGRIETSSSTKTQSSIPMLKPSAAFNAEILSALSEDVDRPDAVCNSPPKSSSSQVFDTDEDDGDLKFKSKKVLWVPKAQQRHPHSSHPGNIDLSTSDERRLGPSSLIDLCLDVIERNLNRVDSVGNVPYELLARALKHVTPEDLARIEKYNPQFVGCSDELWQRHVQRDHQNYRNAHPDPGETWCALYQRLAKEETRRLNRIISQSARRVKEELESRRTTLPTEVITPRQLQRRGTRRPDVNHSSSRANSRNNEGRNSSGQGLVNFRPYNVSHPATNQPVIHPKDRPTPVVSSSLAGSSQSGRSSDGLLNKLRKQFRLGRPR